MLPLPCELRISESISLPYQGFFSPFPHGTVHYRCTKVFSLRPWSARIHTRFHVSDITWELLKRYDSVMYGTITLYGWNFQSILLLSYFVKLFCVLTRYTTLIPQHCITQRLAPWHVISLGSSQFARHYYGNLLRFLFLMLLRYFISHAYSL